MTVAEMEKTEEGLHVNQKKVDWARDILSLVKKGVITDLHIGRSRFEKKITKEDLGLDIPDNDFQNFVKEYLDFGTKVLLPRRVKAIFDRIEGKARRNLYNHSFETPWGRFVPYTAYEKYKERRLELQEEYTQAKNDLIASLETYNLDTMIEYKKAAERIYERTSKTKSLEQFTKDFLVSVESQLPTEELIERTFYFEQDIYYIPLPSELEQDFMKADLIKHERRLEEAKTQGEIDKVRSEVQMHRDTISKIEDTKQKKLDGMINSIAFELGGAIYSTLKDVLGSLKNRTNLSGSSVKSLKLLVERTRMLNFLEDDNVESALQQIEAVVNGTSKKKAGDSAALLTKIATEFKCFSLEGDDLPDIREFGMMF